MYNFSALYWLIYAQSTGQLPFSGTENPMAPLPSMHDQRYSASHYCWVLLDRIFFKNEIFLQSFFRSHYAHRILRGRKRTLTRENLKSAFQIAFFLWSQKLKIHPFSDTKVPAQCILFNVMK